MTKTPDSVTNGRRCFLCYIFLCGMKRFVQMIVVLLLSSCGVEQIDTGVHSGADGIWYGPSYGKHMSGTVYAVGLDYPEGYDWRTDTDKGRVRCSLVLFADMVPVLKVPVGDDHEVSSDNARHRVRSGCLYTDYTDGKTTVIRKDGQEVFRFDGAEEIADLEIHGGRLHTLGYPKGGTGFVYRIDGEAVVTRDSGTLLSGLSIYDGKVCFCFSRQTVSSSGAVMNHYLSEDGKVSLVVTDQDVEEILDMAVYADGLYVLASVRGVGAPVLIKGESRRSVNYFSTLDIVSCRFIDTETMSVRVRYRHPDSDYMSDIVWTEEHGWRRFMRGGMITSLFNDKDGYHAVVYSSELQEGAVFSGNSRHELDVRYHAYGENCLTVRDSMVYVGLTSRTGNGALIWRDGDLDTLRLNGPVTCLR